ncbi:hypothetical protein RAJCM14343_5556 [Rhodococcus aetherivorans]|uniref:Uncharacterized protein n=1 Tax=Rhodococcus aetherivorans TaxID=191292 RepID=A0ABQ0YUX1_9NOCA|nr:hypothetical protein RAJCM14343_5556 [Rhodococcus aetherivorans]CCW10398.1 hypothetical protein EBESD8_9290 [Rhodococcus aetherivorans]
MELHAASVAGAAFASRAAVPTGSPGAGWVTIALNASPA